MADSPNQSTVSSNNNYEFPIDSCDHMISTSLRDLRKKYSDLRIKKSSNADIEEKKRKKEKKSQAENEPGAELDGIE